MYVKYGSFQHASDETTISVGRTPIRAPNGVTRGMHVTFSLAGRYYADTVAGVTSGLGLLEAAYVDGQRDFALQR